MSAIEAILSSIPAFVWIAAAFAGVVLGTVAAISERNR